MAKALEGNTASVTTSRAQLRQIGFLPLLALFYGYTAGGPFGYEEIFQGSGPGMSLVFLTFVPFLWSIPISFAAAEMNSILPVQGGFYRWVRAAFGNFWGFQCGWWNWTGTFLMNGAYAVALADYTAQLFPTMARGWQHWLVAVFFIAAIALLNVLGVQVVGNFTIAMLFVVLAPVAVFTVMGFAHAQVNPFHPFVPPGKSWHEVYGVGLALALWLYSGYE